MNANAVKKKIIGNGQLILCTRYYKSEIIQIKKGLYEFGFELIRSTHPSIIEWDVLLFIGQDQYVLHKIRTLISISEDTEYSFFNCTCGEVSFNYYIKQINFL
jgi:hypothetical protein